MDITLSGRRYEILIDFCTHANPSDALTRVRPFITEPEPRYAEYLRTGHWPRHVSMRRTSPEQNHLLPETPDPDWLRQLINERIVAIHRNCRAQTAGTAAAIMVFRNDGTVHSVQITDAPPAMRECIQTELRQVTVPPFATSTFRHSVRFAFRGRSASSDSIAVQISATST